MKVGKEDKVGTGKKRRNFKMNRKEFFVEREEMGKEKSVIR